MDTPLCHAHWGTSEVWCHLPKGHLGEHKGSWSHSTGSGQCGWPSIPQCNLELIERLNDTIKKITESLYIVQDPQRVMLCDRINDISQKILSLSTP